MFRKIKKETTKDTLETKEELEEETPDELMERGNNLIKASLAQELLYQARKSDPYYFEKIVGELLSAMGYGEYEVTPRSGDKGVDGVIYQDKLGLDRIYFQAKRYDEKNPVTAKDVQSFVGALEIHKVRKGVFITTSRFPKSTKDDLKQTQKTIILIDGTKLAKLMIENDVGVTTEKIYKIKKIDLDFFQEE